MNLTKKDVQQRVLQNGKPLDLDKFSWDQETNTFSSKENNLFLNFKNINSCTFKTGSYCTFDTEDFCTFDTGFSCTFKTGIKCVIIRRDVYEVIEIS